MINNLLEINIVLNNISCKSIREVVINNFFLSLKIIGKFYIRLI